MFPLPNHCPQDITGQLEIVRQLRSVKLYIDNEVARTQRASGTALNFNVQEELTFAEDGIYRVLPGREMNMPKGFLDLPHEGHCGIIKYSKAVRLMARNLRRRQTLFGRAVKLRTSG